MILNAGSSAPPQPSGANVQVASEELSSLTRSTSTVTLDGVEPKMFPGVVSRRRRSSLRSSTVEDREDGHSGFRRHDGSAVVEEQDTDDDA